MGRILVVDDEKSIRITLKAFLSEEGYDVQVAEDAGEAIKLVQETDFDVIVTDIVLPRTTGVDLLKTLRELSPNSKVIMMTGEPTVETSSESLRLGAFDYLFKPISKNKMLITVRNALNAKRLEDESRQHKEELERIVQERTAELESKNIMLFQAQKMEAIGTLAGGIAHDFNNILSSIIGFTQLALDNVGTNSELKDDLQEIFTAGNRAKDLVKQILAFARQSDDEIQPVKIGRLLREAIKFIRSTIPTTIEIKQNIMSNSFVMGNPTQFHQVLMNLLTNAYQAMQEKGGLLEISLKDIIFEADSKIPIWGFSPGNYQELKIKDSGVGIKPEHLDSIFEPYFTTKKIGEGTGLGLAMVHGIIKKYNGAITVDSILGGGSTFTIYLPITDKQKTHLSYQPEILPTGTERILFVDDEASIVKMGRRVLEQLGYQITTRTSSVEALELFRSKPDDFDLVITDMTMPNMTGDRLTIELVNIRPDIPVILYTGYSTKVSAETASEIGIKAFEYKPIVKADLAKTIRKVLDEINTKSYD